MSRIQHDLRLTKPDYAGGSIVNLMSAIGLACGAPAHEYAPLPNIDQRLAEAKRVVLLVIDGLGLELLESIAPDSMLAKQRIGEMTSVYPPTTASAITTYMTGLAPQQHALTGWFMHFRHLGAVAAVLPFMPRYGTATLSEVGVDIGSVVDCVNFFDTISGESIALMPREICDSVFSRRLGGRSKRVPYASVDDFSQNLVGMCSGKTDARFVYAYWSELDRLSHIHGPSGLPVAEHLAMLDRALTPVFDVCEGSGTLLLVTADHGFIDSGADERIDLQDHPGLQEMLSQPLCGEPRTAYCYVRARCAQAFEQYVTEVLADKATLIASEQLIDDGWFGTGEPHAELAARVGDYTLQMKERYTISDQVPGERRIKMNGVHGGTAAAEMYVPLISIGP